MYTKAEKKARVLTLLNWLERYEGDGRHMATELAYKKEISALVPKGKQPLDWATEPD
ncbi:hypothetical protein [Myxococcus phage Mx1]|nr:hypothetical protein [Myxococcus phage Mx1]